jgi:hypothetical protein
MRIARGPPADLVRQARPCGLMRRQTTMLAAQARSGLARGVMKYLFCDAT